MLGEHCRMAVAALGHYHQLCHMMAAMGLTGLRMQVGHNHAVLVQADHDHDHAALVHVDHNQDDCTQVQVDPYPAGRSLADP